VAKIVQKMRELQRDHPFAVSAVYGGFGHAAVPRLCLHGRDFAPSVPLCRGLARLWKLRRTVEAQLDAGYGFIKVKSAQFGP